MEDGPPVPEGPLTIAQRFILNALADGEPVSDALLMFIEKNKG